MKMIYAEEMKYVLDFVRWRNSMIKVYANEHTVEWLKTEIDKQDKYLADQVARIELLLEEEKEAV